MSASTGIKPIAVTMGEPSGVGPELVARIWSDRQAHDIKPFFFIGARESILAVAPQIPCIDIKTAEEACASFGEALPVLNLPLKAPLTLGTPSPENGRITVDAIDKAVELALSSRVSAIVTSPINKEALYKTGFTAPGHTEYLARLSSMSDDASIMMLAASGLRVIPVTIHIPLKDVTASLTADKIIHAALVAHHDLKKRFGIEKPRIAVAGLNPHAGEGGTIGIEEATHIMPAIWALRDEGIDVSDPKPADTLFHAEARKDYDVVLCMYHDQALIPIKTLDFWGGVNITLGLPFIRTSPDHGTALPLAGTGQARIDSMLEAIKVAGQMANRQENP